jgi:ABC-type Fe3+/spermidine/putrescine transport system ATPase subunit/ABC-type spermidine/putrescine transport system permease subunit II
MNKRNHLFYLQLALTLLTCAFLLVPVIQSVLAGVTVNYFVGIKSGLTLRWLGEVWRLYSDTIFRSIGLGLACLVVDLIAGIPAAYVMVKTRSRFTRLLEEFLVMPLAIPGLAIALAILISYGWWTDFRSSWLIILVGHVIFTLPFMIRSVIAVMTAINMEELEEGAASLGAGFPKRFVGVVIPNVLSGILAGSLMVFTLSIGEFNLTWMLHTPFTKTLPVGLADSYASMRLEIGSAYTITFFFMIIPLLMAMQWVSRPRTGRAATEDNTEQARMENQSQLSETTAPADAAASQAARRPGTAIRLTRCAKTFPGGTRALESLDLEVAAGETVVILGPSGCGKTTLLRIIAGLETPDEGGGIFFNDDEVTAIPIEKRNVGMVFQSYALFPNMDVADNIAYGLKVRGDEPDKIRARVDEMLAMMQIEELRGRPINQLSGGQKQRVALARAIAVRPRVLLLDEPLTALDAKLRDVLRVEIDLLLRSIGITAVYVTHDQAEAMALGDRIVVMSKGRIAQIGSPRDVYFKPANRFVADFIGTVNCIESTVADRCLTFPGGCIPVDDLEGVDVAGGGMLNIFFRPEHATVVEAGQGHFQAKVLSAFFLGDRTRLLVNGDTPEPLKVEAPGRQAFRKGETVDILLDLEALFTLSEA